MSSSKEVVVDRSQLRRVALSSLLGTVLEYYDFLLYGTMAALVFGELFFPSSNPALSTIAAFGTLAAGYAARPLGGVIFGHFGDRLGRKTMLIVTMVVMGAASFIIGLLPTYEAIGVLAPVLLVTLRIVQGFAIGGEWGGAALMVIEHAEPERRGRWAGIMQLGSPIGFLLATVVVMVVSLLPDESLYSWGWRVPFLLSALLVVVGLYMRLGVVESPVFQEAVDNDDAQVEAKTPLLRVLRHPRALILACAAGIGPFALTALATSHIIAYAKGIGYDQSDVMRALVIIAMLSLITIPFFSALSDRVGRRGVALAGAIGAVVFALPMYALVDTVSALWLTVALLIAQVVQNLMYAPLAPLLSEMFGTETRYTGVSLGYQMASLIGAGFTPLIASSLLAATGGSSLPLSCIIVVTALITGVAVWRIVETRGRDLTTGFDESSPGRIEQSEPDAGVRVE
ncbi:putative MFS family arabinose efflux permease [Rhodococcus sp. SMB37]|uniref:MFS transporter n=1 Tax=Rhodococcus sp. SMB37 TaxID=2512213 RepID=UPI00104392AD|nr:MFS transporter [Rhodococcus sp. SMB37]TCN49812.1 putative MFS family arabinose efflux permease [Rhodococcus sp. SMB37]